MILESGSRMGGAYIHNDSNHASSGNPHNQYVTKRDYIRIPARESEAKNDYTLLEISITDQDTCVFAVVDIINANNSYTAPISMAKVAFKVNVAGALSKNFKGVYLQKIYAVNFPSANIYATVVESTDSIYKVRLYYANPSDNTTMYYRFETIMSTALRRKWDYRYELGYSEGYLGTPVAMTE